MDFNIISLQKLRAVVFIPVYNEVHAKVVTKKQLPQGDLEQVALMSETKEVRLTLDCTILSQLSREILSLATQHSPTLRSYLQHVCP